MVGSENTSRRFLGAGAMAVALLSLVSCQTDDFKPASDEQASAAVAGGGDTGLYNQTLGSGSVKVAYLGIRRADQPSRQADSEYRDGAALAVNTLGSDVVKLTMVETTEKPDAIEATTKTLARQQVSLIITTARGAEFEIIQRGLGGLQIPIVSFQANDVALPPNVYAFVSSPTDSLIESASFAMAEGATHAVILASSAAEKIEAERIAQQIKAFGGKVEPIVELAGGALPPKALVSWSKADMVVLMPGIKSPGEVLKKADAAKPPRPGRRIVASAVLTSQDLHDPKLTGSIVCRYDQNVQARIGSRFMASYGMPASAHAGYGFDAMAMAIGLAGRFGDAGFAPERIMSPDGFSGSLGVFRLEGERKVRRNCDIFKVAKGSYVFFQKAPPTL
ncbi:hypothetical protein GVN24_09420 [Rhizobium sp. CRIBSB]|nr:hypothetical protein [Rhizobium sp. CRIBSB]